MRQPETVLQFTASPKGQILVSAPPDKVLSAHPDWLVTEPTAAYTEALVSFLAAELAASDPIIAAGIARRAEQSARSKDQFAIACRLLSETRAGRVTLDRERVDALSYALKNTV
jgi:hypothetical protein